MRRAVAGFCVGWVWLASPLVPTADAQDVPRVEIPAPVIGEVAGPTPPSPRGAMLRSMVVPGWGQVYNGDLLKGALFAAGQVTLAVRGVRAQRDANDYEDMAAALDGSARNAALRAKNRALDRRDDFIWWSAFALLFSAIDAYVDAALWDIGPEFEGVDVLDTPEPSIRIGLSLPLR